MEHFSTKNTKYYRSDGNVFALKKPMKRQSNKYKIAEEFKSVPTGGTTSSAAWIQHQLSSITQWNQSSLPILKLPGFGVKKQCPK